jgi:hypothetical protein
LGFLETARELKNIRGGDKEIERSKRKLGDGKK